LSKDEGSWFFRKIIVISILNILVMSPSILLVEDDVNLGFILCYELKAQGYDVKLCLDGIEGIQEFHNKKYHLCILDVMMPRKDGFTLAKEIRAIDTDTPILFLTAKSMTEDRVEGFKVGGDDYLTKPFSSEELQLRIKALLKRVNIKLEEDEEKIFKIGNYYFDSENYTLKTNQFEKILTKKEAQILKVLVKYKNQVTPRDIILNAVWGQDDYFVGRSMDVFITKIRKYLKEDPRIQITNIHGIGFKFEIN
jgi:DNA-binding response OmpR family regulator